MIQKESLFLLYYFLLHSMKGEILDLTTFNYLYALGCFEHDFTIFIKFLSVLHKFCGCAREKTNGWNCIKFYIHLWLNAIS